MATVGEQVLVISRARFEEIVPPFQGIETSDVSEALAEFLAPAAFHFMDRAEAEEDPSHKQLIPYCVFRCGEQILCYTRGKSGGESRLHEKISVGIGGHINPIDGLQDLGNAMYYNALTREIEEELELDCDYEARAVALINDDSNPVGQVHLGVVHLIELPNMAVRAREDALANLQFLPLEQLNGEAFDRLETWSQHCIRALANEEIS